MKNPLFTEIMRKARILIVDDEADICSLLAETLADPHHQIEWSTRPQEALQRVRNGQFDLILLDIKMPEISGLDLLPRLKKSTPDTAFMMMSGYGNIAIAVEAMKRGADDYLEKPFKDIEEVKLSVQRLLDSVRMKRENRYLRKQLDERFKLEGLISVSPKMREVVEIIRKVAPLSTTVLIIGETGTGKELVAKTLHQNSKRSYAQFVCVNCGGLPANLLESLLFGHEKGSFTGAYQRTRGFFEEADGGTLFLDEIGEMPLPLQVKLLRTIQERTFQRLGGSEELPVDFRLIAATNKNLKEEVEKGNFRQDLYYRLNVVTIHLPPLREREDDIPLLARHFLNKYCEEFHLPRLEITREALEYLKGRAWLGNVRQLENSVQRAVALAEGRKITADAFRDGESTIEEDFYNIVFHLPMREARLLFEKHYLLENLRRHGGSVTKAARDAGLPRQNYHRKMKQLGITAALSPSKTIPESEPEPV
jgi:DNA-binding NtrC family response regulator